MEQLDKILRDKGVLLNESELSEVMSKLRHVQGPRPVETSSETINDMEATALVEQKARMKPQPPHKQLGIIDKQNLESSPLKRRSRGPMSTKSKSINNSKLKLVEVNSGDNAAVGIEPMTKENDFLKWGQPKEQNSKCLVHTQNHM